VRLLAPEGSEVLTSLTAFEALVLLRCIASAGPMTRPGRATPADFGRACGVLIGKTQKMFSGICIFPQRIQAGRRLDLVCPRKSERQGKAPPPQTSRQHICTQCRAQGMSLRWTRKRSSRRPLPCLAWLRRSSATMQSRSPGAFLAPAPRHMRIKFDRERHTLSPPRQHRWLHRPSLRPPRPHHRPRTEATCR
jgi:hypothetical protein